MVCRSSSIALMDEGWAPLAGPDKDSGLVFARRVCFVMGVPDKLTEILEWKRREIAPLMRAVSERELLRLDASIPKPLPFIPALRRDDGSLGGGPGVRLPGRRSGCALRPHRREILRGIARGPAPGRGPDARVPSRPALPAQGLHGASGAGDRGAGVGG